MRKFLLPLVIVLVLVGAMYYVYNGFLISDDTYLFEDLRDESLQSQGVDPSTSSVEVADNVQGEQVIIPRVYLTHPGFVMIHESDDGTTGAIVMTGDYLRAGLHENVIVETGITTKPGESYSAMLHEDDGNGVYDDPGTDPPVYVGREIVQKEFNIINPITAEFEVVIDGVSRVFNKNKYFNQSQMAYLKPGDASTVHVAVSSVTWGNFFDTLPFSVTEDCITTGIGETYCDDKDSKITFLLDGVENKNVLDEAIEHGTILTVRYERFYRAF